MSVLQLEARRVGEPAIERHKVIVIGGGQAGLSVGYHLARLGVPFVILDANRRIGDAWRQRWDSLKLFSPAQFDGLDGMAFPAPAGTFPSKDQMADYLTAYAGRFKLPVRSGMKVDGLARVGDRYRLDVGDMRFEADHVVVAMTNFQKPSKPTFAANIDRSIAQLHSSEYRNPGQLSDGPVLVVGAGNSGAEIALELSRTRKTYLSGDDVGEAPFRVESLLGRHIQSRLIFRLVFHRLLTTKTPMGRKTQASHKAAPLIRTRRRDLAAAGVEPTPKMTGTSSGYPQLADGRVLEISNVIWCSGFHADHSWIDLPVFDAAGQPSHVRGVAAGQAGLYFVGLHFLYAMSSTMVHGVGRDARFIAAKIARRIRFAAVR